MNGQCLTHQALGGGQRTGGGPVGFGHGQQFDAVEQARLQQEDPLQTGIHLQTIETVRRDGFAMDVGVQRKAVTEIVQQPPFEGAQQRLQRPTFGQRQQGRGVVIEDRRDAGLRRAAGESAIH